MKIAIVHPSLKVKGGAENVVVWLAEELARRGHQVDIITTDFDEEFYGPISSKSYGVLLHAYGGYQLKPLQWILNGWWLRRQLANYDVVNPHNFPAYIWVYWAKRFNPTIGQIVWFCEEPVRGFYRQIIDQHVLKVIETDAQLTRKGPLADRLKKRSLAQTIVFACQYAKQQYAVKILTPLTKRIDDYVVPKLDKILTNSSYIATTIDKIFHLPAQPCLLGIPDDRFAALPQIRYDNFLFTPTRFFFEKNLFNCIRAVKILVDAGEFPADKYVITGSGALFKDVQRFVQQQGLEEIVELRGFVSEEELAECYATASLVMYLPLDETYGLVFPEAGFYQKAVIGPNQGGPQEIIQQDKTGIMVDPLDPVAIAAGIKQMFGDRERLRQMGLANERLARSELTFQRFVDRYLALLSDSSS